jgi:predicted ATPase
MREVVATVGEQARVLVGRCLPYGEGITYWPLVEIVKQVAEEEPRAVISELLSEDESGELVADLVAGAVGASERLGSMDETHWAVRRLLEALAHKCPLVLVLEDLHWAEPTFLDLLEYVAGFSAGEPILLLASARPELLETRPAWGKLGSTSQLVPLEPLAEPDVDALIDGRLEGDALSERLRARVLEVAEGNPLFVEQLLAMQAKGGDADGEVGVPPTLRALLAARIDRLDAGERAVLERAAVEGRGFHRGAVAELLPALERAAVGARLLALVRMELIRPDRSEFADDDGYRFAHVLIRDAAYESTAKEIRAELHERYANWLERKVADRVREYEEILGYHLEQACRYRQQLMPVDEQTLSLARRAAMRLVAAGRPARWGDPAEAALLSRAVSLLPEGDADRLALLPELGDALAESGNLRGGIAVLEDAIEQAESAGDRRTRSYGALFLAGARWGVEPGFTAEEALGEAQRALRAFEELGDVAGQARAWWLCAYYHSARGHHAEALEELERALAHAATAGADEESQDGMRSLTATCLFWGPASLDEFFSYADRLLDQPNTKGIVSVRQWLGVARAMQGQFETARTLLAEEVAELEEFGNTFRAALAAANAFGLVEMLAGNPAAAEQHLSAGYIFLKELGETAHLSTLAGLVAHALYEQGQDSEAAHYTRISEETAARDDYASQILWRTARAKEFARQGRVIEAERVAREAVTLAEGTDDINMHADALMALAEVLRLANRSSEAAAVIQEALNLYEQKGNVVSAGKARALLGELQTRSEF